MKRLSVLLVFALSVTVSVTSAVLSLSPQKSSVYYFVSFAMPDKLLRQSLREAAHYHIPIIIRGLVDNSFHATAKRLFDLIKKDNQGGVLLNPLLFRHYQIYAVPALVLIHGRSVDTLRGNLSITQALKTIQEKGENVTVARQILHGGFVG